MLAGALEWIYFWSLAQALSRRLGREGLVPWFFAALFVPLLAGAAMLLTVRRGERHHVLALGKR